MFEQRFLVSSNLVKIFILVKISIRNQKPNYMRKFGCNKEIGLQHNLFILPKSTQCCFIKFRRRTFTSSEAQNQEKVIYFKLNVFTNISNKYPLYNEKHVGSGIYDIYSERFIVNMTDKTHMIVTRLERDLLPHSLSKCRYLPCVM